MEVHKPEFKSGNTSKRGVSLRPRPTIEYHFVKSTTFESNVEVVQLRYNQVLQIIG